MCLGTVCLPRVLWLGDLWLHFSEVCVIMKMMTSKCSSITFCSFMKRKHEPSENLLLYPAFPSGWSMEDHRWVLPKRWLILTMIVCEGGGGGGLNEQFLAYRICWPLKATEGELLSILWVYVNWSNVTEPSREHEARHPRHQVGSPILLVSYTVHCMASKSRMSLSLL